MAARILDGRALASELRDGLARRVVALRERGVAPTLVVVMVGEDDSSLAYVRGMRSLGAKIGVDVVVDLLPLATDDAGVRAALQRYDEDPAVHGVILQQPLPRPSVTFAPSRSSMPERKRRRRR
jgi:methylenetetrahydrofolate dehydrogenase (NADP+)/methenyltetrahydrofolate cyclohydrolase